MNPPSPPARSFLIPDLCQPAAVLFLLLIGVLLALDFELYADGLERFDWIGLGRSAAFILWNMLASAALLCLLRARIARWPLASGAAFAYALVIGVCAASNLGAQALLGLLRFGATPAPDPWWLGRDVAIAALLGGAALRYFHLQGELLRQQRAGLDARVAALQARIRPHFLFNSMNIIASLIPLDPERAERAVEDLSALFRASLREGSATVPLAEELDLCERYLRLEQLRLGERLAVEQEFGALAATLRVPPLSIQPLLENAVYHGIQKLAEGGRVRFALRQRGDSLIIEVANPLPPDAVAPSAGSGIALANIRDRLHAIYGGHARFDTEAGPGSYLARLTIPVEPPR